MGVTKLTRMPSLILRTFSRIVFFVLCAAIVGLAFSMPAEGVSGDADDNASNQDSDEHPSARQKSSIVQNCPAIKQSLGQLQKIDSKTRTYLGTTYETIATKFITPLNLRLVKNNLPTFSTIQTNFMTEQGNFRSDYTEYMRELEGLIGIDCRNNPDEFYSKLTIVREKRSRLRSDVQKLSKLTSEQYKSVEKLKKEL